MTIVTLCGSTRFHAEFHQNARELSLRGHVVFTLAMFGRQAGDVGKDGQPFVSDEDKLVLDAVHMAKIVASDAILVINPGGYIGESTTREIIFARIMGKRVQAIYWDAKISRLARPERGPE